MLEDLFPPLNFDPNDIKPPRFGDPVWPFQPPVPGAKCYNLGDYNGIVAVEGGFIHTWGDSSLFVDENPKNDKQEKNEGDVNIYLTFQVSPGCPQPTPTPSPSPTPTPPEGDPCAGGVGGTTELLSGGNDSPTSAGGGSSGSDIPYAALAGGLAAAVVAVGGGGWYVRRRRVRR